MIRQHNERGFSLVELMISILVLSIVLGAMMTFMGMLQQRYTRAQRASGVSQSGKTALELLSLDIGQAGYHPGRTTSIATDIAAGATSAQLGSTTGIFVGSVLIVDLGINQESVTVTAVDPSTNTVTALFQLAHSAASGAIQVRVSDAPYPEGILLLKDSSVPGFATITSNGTTLRLMGDLWDDASLRYVEYRYRARDGVSQCDQGALAPANQPPCVLLRADSSAFDNAQQAAVIVAENLYNSPVTGGAAQLPFQYTTPCPQVSTFNYLTYVPASAPCPSTGAFTYATSVTVNLIMRTAQPVERGGGGQTQMIMRQTFAPRNILYAMRIAQDGLQELLPRRPPSVPVP